MIGSSGSNRDGLYYLNKRPIRSEELEPALKVALAAGPNDHLLYLKAARQLPYEQILYALNIAHENGAAVLGLIVEERAAPGR